MNSMAPTRPTELQLCRVRLTKGPAAPGEARAQVRAAIRAWELPVDADVAVLLTSELVTNAISHEPGDNVMLAIACSGGVLRVDVYDTSRSLPVVVDAPADAEAGRGLMLVATLAADWGYYRTPAGKTVWFALVAMPNREAASSPRADGAQGRLAGDVRP
jgi:anti-sigma regulatory factor (Ser/Thr protein kinase)